MHLLHLLDSTTPPDSFEQLALLAARLPEARHSFAILGSHHTAALATHAGISTPAFHYLPSAGWADPTGWRALRRLGSLEPTHLFTWGASAVAAASVTTFRPPIPRFACFTDSPATRHLRLMRISDSRGGANPWQWLAFTPTTARSILSAGINPSRLRSIPAAAPLAPAPRQGDPTPSDIRLSLGLAPTDGPILLLAGDGQFARHDFGIWSAAILQHLLPSTRVLVREDPRLLPDSGVERFMHTLADDSTLVVAPPDTPWSILVQAADIVLATPDTPDRCGGTGALRAAMAAPNGGVPIVATPQPCITDWIAHGHTGLLAKATHPRAIAARLEEFMSDSTLRYPLTNNARAFLHEHHAPSKMIEAVMDVLQPTTSPAPVDAP